MLVIQFLDVVRQGGDVAVGTQIDVGFVADA